MNTHGSERVYEFLKRFADLIEIDWDNRTVPVRPTTKEIIAMNLLGPLCFAESHAVHYYYWLINEATKKWYIFISTPPGFIKESTITKLNAAFDLTLPPSDEFGEISSDNSVYMGHARKQSQIMQMARFFWSEDARTAFRGKTIFEIIDATNIFSVFNELWKKHNYYYNSENDKKNFVIPICAQLNQCQHVLSIKTLVLQFLNSLELPKIVIGIVFSCLDAAIYEVILF